MSSSASVRSPLFGTAWSCRSSASASRCVATATIGGTWLAGGSPSRSRSAWPDSSSAFSVSSRAVSRSSRTASASVARARSRLARRSWAERSRARARNTVATPQPVASSATPESARTSSTGPLWAGGLKRRLRGRRVRDRGRVLLDSGAGDAALERLCLLGQPPCGGREQEGVEAAVVLDGAQGPRRQAQPDVLAERVGQQRGVLQIGQEAAAGPVVGVADVVAGQHTLARDLAAA